MDPLAIAKLTEIWDDRLVFRALWQRIARLFGGGSESEEGRRIPGGIPAPQTLVAKVANVKNKDRDILRVAGEAIRRGHPDQAVIAYWKAVEVYLKDGQVLKAVSTLKMILHHAPEDLDAFHALSDAYEALDRKRDAANTCLWIADIHARRGQRNEALASLYRSMELDPMVKGARERIQALGGELPASARPPSQMGPPLRLQSKQDPAATPLPAPPPPAPSPPPPAQRAKTPSQPSAPAAPAPAPARPGSGLPPIRGIGQGGSGPIRGIGQGGSGPISGIPLRTPLPAAIQPAIQPMPLEDDPDEMPGESVVVPSPLSAKDLAEDIDLELEEDAIDFPDDSLVLPVAEPRSTTFEPDPENATIMSGGVPYRDEYEDEDEDIDPEVGNATIAMEAIDVGAATIAMQAISDDGEVMSEDLAGDVTMLAMEAPPWDGPTDEHDASVVQEELRHEQQPAPVQAPAPRRFTIPGASTTVDLTPPSSIAGSEHDPQVEAPRVGIVGESTRAYSVDELRKLGVKIPKD